MCGSCVALVTVSCSSRESQCATTPRPSIGLMHCRAVRNSRVTETAALAATAAMSSSTRVSRKRLSPQSSCTKAESGCRAASMSCTAGSASKSTCTAAARSSASARLGATHMAIISPTWRTLPWASGGCSEGLKPGKVVTARIGSTPSRSFAVKTRSRMASGIETARMRPWAMGLRTKATSCMPASRTSATNWPRPRM